MPKKTNSSLGAFTSKLLRPVLVPMQIFTADRRPRALDRLDEVLHLQRRLQQLLRIDIDPIHLDRTLVARRAGCKLFYALYVDLRQVLVADWHTCF